PNGEGSNHRRRVLSGDGLSRLITAYHRLSPFIIAYHSPPIIAYRIAYHRPSQLIIIHDRFIQL
ncbi:hypothetical protein, partial [Prevotella denticola]|uniref:hypothetical protein n=1 Tax=Prevotella denticola TaxID=28129 RepID=UPI00241C05FA